MPSSERMSRVRNASRTWPLSFFTWKVLPSAVAMPVES